MYELAPLSPTMNGHHNYVPCINLKYETGTELK